MRTLALTPGGIGDQILLFPTFDDLKRYYPEAEIDVIVEPRSKGAYRVSGSVNQVIAFDYKDRNGLADFSNLLGIIREREYDVAIALGRRWSIGILLWMSGIPVRMGYAANAQNWLFTNTVPMNTQQYAASMYHDLLKGLGINSVCPELTLRVPKADLEWAQIEQQRLGATESGYIIIHGSCELVAHSQGIDQIYPVKKWQQIIEEIQQKQPNLPIVLVQAPEDDPEWSAAMIQSIPDLKLTTPGDIGKLAAIIASANLMLCTDSTPMHIAVAVGTYTIALFGPTEANKLLPASNHCIGLQSSTGWIADIEPEEVLKKIWGT
ncbi:MAG: glycosyltransferase family 9 protein [Symploca sp. SIO3C6]|uniref:Glycosyltransferase family 9 protein n=1 Tax=Symploca sp. SIO1C4 TaxID=2607765 RepID=A0A6B3N8Q9_9CYAN|nr:glycosyltransferase family 9 protein [Symploca sp. SIO3C6]NER27002.1 glycosyltransferase family 9 protein [Symploca sp. SIO1C4]NET06389.1 glycosyltransferase family 9 protein [Symploca sp. SIO2B6]